MIKRINQDSAFLLEEVFQLLKESLKYCPFSQQNNSPTQKHISRLKQLLGHEFSLWLSETGSLSFAALMTSKSNLDNIKPSEAVHILSLKKIYNQLLLVSQLTMSIGIHAERTMDVLIELQQLLDNRQQNLQDIDIIIFTTLEIMQTQVKDLILVIIVDY